ncbi:MAG TPA: ornithine carbamoyltransferase [Candidatus Acidoferrales bacterium]|nr:ornithine carbamoyltransferase [Candidatus Acidoferrales bacterium]
MNKRDLLSFGDLARRDMEELFALARKLKRQQRAGAAHRLLAGKTLALVFQKPSLRTRASFEAGMFQLGGYSIFLGPDEINLGVRETPADCARNLSRWVDLIAARTFAHETVEEMARHATVPVINGLTDLFHPCQVLADCFTLIEKRGKLDGLKVAFVGDGNNMVHSWIEAAEKYRFYFALACPQGYEPNAQIAARARERGAQVMITRDPEEAVQGADVIYTDVWTSMGQEAEAERRRRDFGGYQVNQRLVDRAGPDALVMHCLPAHRGEEITDEVLDGPRSVVLEQAENRLHVQKAVMVWLLRGLKSSRAPKLTRPKSAKKRAGRRRG